MSLPRHGDLTGCSAATARKDERADARRQGLAWRRPNRLLRVVLRFGSHRRQRLRADVFAAALAEIGRGLAARDDVGGLGQDVGVDGDFVLFAADRAVAAAAHAVEELPPKTLAHDLARI